MFIRQRVDRHEELVVIDWAFCGYGALGTEIVSLVGDSMLVFELEAAAVPELESAAFAAYLKGLHEGGWQGNTELVRLAHAIRTALYLGAAAPALVAAWTGNSTVALQQLGRSADEIATGWESMCEYALEHGDKARKLMDKLGF